MTRFGCFPTVSRATVYNTLTALRDLDEIVVPVISNFVVGVPLPLGVIAHEGSTLIVVANGLRLLR